MKRDEYENSCLVKGPATWRQKVGDIPVEIIKVLGKYDGKVYYLIKGIVKGFEGTTGVPEDELIQKKEE